MIESMCVFTAVRCAIFNLKMHRNAFGARLCLYQQGGAYIAARNQWLDKRKRKETKRRLKGEKLHTPLHSQ